MYTIYFPITEDIFSIMGNSTHYTALFESKENPWFFLHKPNTLPLYPVDPH